MKTSDTSLHVALSLAMCLMLLSARSAHPQPAAYDDDAVRAEAVRAFSQHSAHNKAIAIAWAHQYGMPVRTEHDGITRELMALDAEGRPLYYSTANANAAISTAANVLRLGSYDLLGVSVTVGVWDAGSVLSTHQEFGGRVRVMDGGASHWHSTHVGGTIAASGTVANARGMAPRALIHSYEWNNDMAEMAARAASAPGQGSKLYLSNHSYGHDVGWYNDGGWRWRYALATMQDPSFGRYNADAHNLDAVAYNAPYYLPMFCGMNSRNDGPASGATCYYWNGSSWSSITYNPAVHPPGDGVYKGGYDTLATYAVAKNGLTVGAVNDAVLNFMGLLLRWPASASMSVFSNWGPADDGRIKPDVVGNGVDVYSSHNSGNAAYSTASGTSMATPNVCGTAAQLLQYFRRFGNEPRASTMKALLIHTADDLGTPGPDYAFGYGLVNGAFAADVIAGDHRGMGVSHIREGIRNNGDPTLEYSYTSAGGAPFKATLCWTDPPGAAKSGDDDRTRNLINDLDLRVIGPGSVTHYPFRLDYANPSAAATRGDNSRDNVEQVLITNPAAGGYIVRVGHFGTLSNSSQRFSLIVTHEPYPLSAPSGVAASDGTYSFYVRVTWNAVPGASSYKLYRHTSNNSAAATLLHTTSATSYNDTSAAQGVLYYYWVKAVSTLSDSGFGSYNTGFLEPVAPTGIAASDGVFIDQIGVAWNAVAGASSYVVYRSMNSAPGSSTPLGASATPSYTDTAVVPGTSYWYWIKTVMSGATSYYSSGDNGYALLTLNCPLWSQKAAKKTSTIKGKGIAPPPDALLDGGWQIGLAALAGNAATPHAGPYLLTPNKNRTSWSFKAKNDATIKYTAKKQALKMTMWTNLPPAWAVYLVP